MAYMPQVKISTGKFYLWHMDENQNVDLFWIFSKFRLTLVCNFQISFFKFCGFDFEILFL